jgi:hypothetical protein
MENQTMSDVPDHEDDVDWKAIFSLVRNGKTAEIPYADERDYARRAKQVARRADKRGIAVEVNRGEGVLRVAPGPAAGGNVVAQTSDGEAEL